MEPVIQHKHILKFAEDKVNLKEEDVKEYREQVNRLRAKMETYIKEHPEYDLVKMLHSGSAKKGTALKTLNDMDIALYVRPSDETSDESRLHDWLIERLKEAYPNLKPDQFVPKMHCVTVEFRGTGLDVDVVPVIYEDEPDDRGYLITKDVGDRVLTSIPLHLEFIRKRKENNPRHYTQVVRLVKWWVRKLKMEDESFSFKSFMADLICAHLADTGQITLNDYPLALMQFFAYIVKFGLNETIVFTDNYKADEITENSTDAIKIFDPVNPENNIAKRYSESDRLRIIESANDALDAITEAQYATTKERALEKWKIVLGPSFNPSV